MDSGERVGRGGGIPSEAMFQEDGIHLFCTVCTRRNGSMIGSGMPRRSPHAWTKRELRLLGKATDSVIAKHLHLTLDQVRHERERRTIPPFARHVRIRWTPAVVAKLGMLSDDALAAELGVSPGAVGYQRQQRKIPAFTDHQSRWTTSAVGRLGTVVDSVIAAEIGVSLCEVRTQRRAQGIPAVGAGRRRPWTRAEERQLGRATDAEIGRRLGRPAREVRYRRELAGIPSVVRVETRFRWSANGDAVLGTMSDRQVALRVGTTIASVRRRRWEAIAADPDWDTVWPIMQILCLDYLAMAHLDRCRWGPSPANWTMPWRCGAVPWRPTLKIWPSEPRTSWSRASREIKRSLRRSWMPLRLAVTTESI